MIGSFLPVRKNILPLTVWDIMMHPEAFILLRTSWSHTACYGSTGCCSMPICSIDQSGNRRILSSVAPVLFHIFFNDTCMSLFIIIIDAYQQNFTCIILNPGSILLFLNLLNCSLSGFLPL